MLNPARFRAPGNPGRAPRSPKPCKTHAFLRSKTQKHCKTRGFGHLRNHSRRLSPVARRAHCRHPNCLQRAKRSLASRLHGRGGPRPAVERDPSFNMLAHGRLRRKHGLPPGFQGLSATSQTVASGEWTRSDGESRGTGLVVWDARCLLGRPAQPPASSHQVVNGSMRQTSASWAASPIRTSARTLCCPILRTIRARWAHRGRSGALSQRMLGAMLAHLGHCLTRVTASGSQWCRPRI